MTISEDVRSANPPAWAENLLRLMLMPSDRDTVSGDLLEQYRESVHPARGRRGAYAWYVTRAVGIVWRVTRLWGVLLALSLLGRNTLDWWLSPTDDYYARSVVSTTIAVVIFAGTGAWTAWRFQSVRASALAGVATGLAAAVIINVAALGQLAIRHDPHTMRMIAAGGGLDEVFLLPFVMILPGAALAMAGGAVGVLSRRLIS